MHPIPLFTLLLPLSATALNVPIVKIRDSPITVPIAASFKSSGPGKFVQADRARITQLLTGLPGLKQLQQILPREDVLVMNDGVTYTASVGVGNPPTTYNLLVDTGSSNTWVGANKSFVRTSATKQTGNTVSVKYGSGSFSGDEVTDEVTIASGFVINHQSLGVAHNSTGFSAGIDGILGIGPVGLTRGTLSPDSNSTIPTVTENLFNQGTIPANILGISFEPTTGSSNLTGELTFGGVDHKKFTGEITFAPITSSSPSNTFWGIDQSLTYGKSKTIFPDSAGFVDTGTTLLLLSTPFFRAYQNATGGVLDSDVGLLRLTPKQFDKLESLFFTIAGTTFEFTPNAQAWPRFLNKDIGGDSDHIYLVVSDLGPDSPPNVAFVNGFCFLQRFYSVYDTDNHRVGIANTPFTDARTN